MPNVGYKRKELRAVERKYIKINDAIDGADEIKRRKTVYLPMPNAADTSKENVERYDAYLTRAVYYNVTGHTLTGYLGELFAKDPVIEVPTQLQTLVDDATGEGVGLVQLAKKTCRFVLPLGRAGLFVDYPKTEAPATKEDIDRLGIRPVIRMYEPIKIINWRTKKIGAETVLSLIVLEEEYDSKDDGFELTKEKQWRVLRLDDSNTYTVELWRKGGGYLMVEGYPVTPTNSAGKPFDRLPFMFIGAEDNDSEVDAPPFFDLADLNIAHYRNSADHEEACFMVSQPTPVVTGLTEVWADRYFKNGIGLGSRAAIPLPAGASAELLQAVETTLSSKEMEHKEKQMTALGAKIAEQQTVQKTATESSLDTASQKSTLSSVSKNVSLAIVWALGFAAEYIGVSEAKITFQINSDFSLSLATPEARAEAISAWQAEALSFTEMRAVLRKSGTATQDDATAKAEIAADGPPTVPGANDGLGDEDEVDENGKPIDKTKTPPADE